MLICGNAEGVHGQRKVGNSWINEWMVVLLSNKQETRVFYWLDQATGQNQSGQVSDSFCNTVKRKETHSAYVVEVWQQVKRMCDRSSVSRGATSQACRDLVSIWPFETSLITNALSRSAEIVSTRIAWREWSQAFLFGGKSSPSCLVIGK